MIMKKRKQKPDMTLRTVTSVFAATWRRIMAIRTRLIQQLQHTEQHIKLSLTHNYSQLITKHDNTNYHSLYSRRSFVLYFGKMVFLVKSPVASNVSSASSSFLPSLSPLSSTIPFQLFFEVVPSVGQWKEICSSSLRGPVPSNSTILN